MAVIAHETYTVQSEGMTLDLIVWQRFKKPMFGLVEKALALPENQHLEHAGAVLPLGTEITIPIETRSAAEEVEVISLWD